jgi:hypothetical protein
LHYEKCCRGFYGDEARPFEARYEVRDGAAMWSRTDLVDTGRGSGRRSDEARANFAAFPSG